MPWIDGDDDEHITPTGAIPQTDTLQPWWRLYRRRRSRSPLYSEPGEVCELPELTVELEASCGDPVLSDEMTELIKHVADVLGHNQQAKHKPQLRRSDVANVTIRKKPKSNGKKQRIYQKRVKVFRIYQFCNCPNHVCPNPHLF